MSAAHKGHKGHKGHNGGSQPHAIEIEVLDIETDITTNYRSIMAAPRALNIRHATISLYLKHNQIKPYKGKYIFKKTKND
jgi:hypothetical protein